jgi:hypothetical protein
MELKWNGTKTHSWRGSILSLQLSHKGSGISVAVSSVALSLLYHTDFNIKSEDFKTYSLVLTGSPVVAYAWQINGQLLAHSSNVFPKAYLNVTLPNGKSFSADTSFF